MNIITLLERQAQTRPNTLALIAPGEKKRPAISYGELSRRSACLAAELADNGIATGDVVLLLKPISTALYEVLFALWRLGATAMFIDPSAGRANLAAGCKAAKPQAMIASPGAYAWAMTAPALRQVPRKFTHGAWLPGADCLGASEHILPLRKITVRDQSDAAMLTFTSGSTGEPKGIVRTHGLLAAQHAALGEAMRPAPGSVDLITLPMFVLSSLAAGATCLLPETDLRQPARVDGCALGSEIVRHQVDRIVAPPTTLERLLDARGASGANLKGVKQIFTGGGPVFPDLLQSMAEETDATITAIYGSSEAEPIAHIDYRQMSEADLRRTADGGGLLAGRSVDHIELAILPDRGPEPIGPLNDSAFQTMKLSAGHIGEIVVGGAHVVPGYLDPGQNQTSKVFVGSKTWHRTGDAGYLDDQNRLWLVGRAAEKSVDEAGTVYPFTVEAAARYHVPGRRAAFVQVAGERQLLIKGNGKDLATGSLRAALGWAGISCIRTVRKIPVDRRHNAKVDYRKLRRLIA